MAADELRLTDDAENDLTIREGDLADRETFGLLHKDGGEPGGGNLPYLHGDADGLGVGGIHPQHGGVVVIDAPQAVARGSGGLPQEEGAGIEEVLFQREAPHEGAIDGELDRIHGGSPLLFIFRG